MQLLAYLHTLNRPILIVIGGLCFIGMLMMVSAGGGDVTEFALPQFSKLVVGGVMMLTLALLPPAWLYRYAYAAYALMLSALMLVDVMGHIGMGAQRWLTLGGMNIQPSEFMKIAAILALARYYHGLHAEDIPRFKYMIPVVLMLALPAVLILRQPNLGTATILLSVGVMMMFMAGVHWRYFIGAGAALLASLPVAWHVLHDYQKQRVLTFLNPDSDPLGAGYNILQSMIAIGSGGIFGKGFLDGSQGQLNFLPEKHTDFIFTMFAEEWGFVGSMVLLGLYGTLLLMGTSVAAGSRSLFGALLAAGVTAMVFVHVGINMAMVMGMIPVVGVPLPFLSYGGSNMISIMLAMGLLLNACRTMDKPLLLEKMV